MCCCSLFFTTVPHLSCDFWLLQDCCLFVVRPKDSDAILKFLPQLWQGKREGGSDFKLWASTGESRLLLCLYVMSVSFDWLVLSQSQLTDYTVRRSSQRLSPVEGLQTPTSCLGLRSSTHTYIRTLQTTSPMISLVNNFPLSSTMLFDDSSFKFVFPWVFRFSGCFL